MLCPMEKDCSQAKGSIPGPLAHLDEIRMRVVVVVAHKRCCCDVPRVSGSEKVLLHTHDG